MNSRTRSLTIASALLIGLGSWLTYSTGTTADPIERTAAKVLPNADPQVITHPMPTTAPVSQQGALAAVGTHASSLPKATTRAMSSAQGTHRLPIQRFKVNAGRDTLLHTEGGCAVRVPANCFVDANGKAAKGQVSLQVQEALTPTDLLLGGLATVHNGRALESGGSFCIMASAMGQMLQLANDMALDMAVPTKMKKAGMKFFPGKVEQGQVVWQQPQPLEAPVPQLAANVAVITDTLTTNVTYRVEGFENPANAPAEVTQRVSDVAWANGGLWLSRDSSFTVGEHLVHFYANEEPSNISIVPNWRGGFNISSASVIGTNTFQEDPAMNYVFQVKRLGWANIDRLLNDKRTRIVDMRTTITDTTGLEDVRISLVMKSHNIYLPGYQRADGGYGFSHGDYEPMQLPVGAKALVVATAQRNGKPWYAMEQVVIEPIAQVKLQLQPTTDAELKAALMAAL